MAELEDDHEPIVMDDFWGHYARGESDDIPPNFLRDTLNLKYATGEVASRDGTQNYLTLANIRRFFPYKRLNENPRYLILDTSGNVYDSIVSLSTPIHTDASWVDFSVLTYNNKAYITPHNRVNGISGKTVWVYDGSIFRVAGGAAPVGFSLVVAQSVTAGIVDKGFRLVAVAFETASGFITPPGPALFAQYTASNNRFEMNVSAIPIGPSGTVARWILATKIIPTYNGNQLGYTFYFLPTGRIGDNTTTTLDFNFTDNNLVDDASYLFNEFATIPAGLGIINYNGRLAYWGIPGSEHIVFLSKSGDPESIDQISGFVEVFPSDNFSGIKGCWAMRGNLYMRKSGSTYNVVDNQQDPVTWVPGIVDLGVGGEVFCGTTIIDQSGASADKYFVAHISGLYNFISAYVKPDISYNINNLWKRINKLHFNLVQVVHDPTTFSIYVAVPLDSATDVSHILYANYVEAIDPLYGIIAKEKVKWSIWVLPDAPSSIASDYNVNSSDTVFKIAMKTGNIYDMVAGLHDDYTNEIDSYGATYLIGDPAETISHFNKLKIRAAGSGTLILGLTGEDESGAVIPASLSLSSAPAKALLRKFNYSNERCSVKFEVNSPGDYFVISRLVLYMNEEFAERPQ